MSPHALSAESAFDAGRRLGPTLDYDPATQRLSLGPGSLSLSARGGNRVVLHAYLDLLGSIRGTRPTSVGEVREDDLDALAAALDLDAPDLLATIEAVLAATNDRAVGILSRLQAERVLAGVAAPVSALDTDHGWPAVAGSRR